MFRNAIVLAALGASAGLALAAGTTPTNIGVSANVASNCTIAADASGLNFGTYDPLEKQDNTTSTEFKILCSKNATYTIGLGAGQGIDATDAARSMKNGSEDAMNYSIYTDVTLQKNWGATENAPTGKGAGLGTGSEITLKVYGKIPKNQWTVGVGAYVDTVVATVSY
jgi:spore coat protein U-like protein